MQPFPPWPAVLVVALIPVVVSFLTCYAMVPLTLWHARSWRLLDIPGERKRHERPVPCCGGICLAAGLAAGGVVSWLSGALSASAGNAGGALPLIAATGIVLALGLYDDVRGCSPGTKLFFQTGAAVLVLGGGNWTGVGGTPFGPVELPGGTLFGAGGAIAVVWLVGFTNAFNLFDGLDGLASGSAAMVAVTLALAALLQGDAASAGLALSLCGASLALLSCNCWVTRVFMGDAGSLTIGFVLAWLALNVALPVTGAVAVLAPLLVLGLPAFDALLVIGHRYREDPDRGWWDRVRRVVEGDRNHLHHLLLGVTGPRGAVLALYGFVALSCAIALMALFRGDAYLAASGLAAQVLLLALGRRLLTRQALESDGAGIATPGSGTGRARAAGTAGALNVALNRPVAAAGGGHQTVERRRGRFMSNESRCSASVTGESPSHCEIAAQTLYLRYDERTPASAGLVHQRANLECLLREAHANGRHAVLPPLNLSPAHNFGVGNEWQWESYFDLAAGRLVDADGNEYPLPLVSSLPACLPSALTLAPGERMPGSARDFVLVVRRIEHGWFEHDVPAGNHRGLRLRMPPSRRVRELAGPVIGQLRALGDGRFAAVHVRRGDRLSLYPRWLTEPEQIRRHLGDQGVPDGSVVFVLSDERDPDFWAVLGEHYRLVRHADYFALAELVSRADGRRPDNYLLYSVECEIMRSAWTRVEGMPGPYWTDPHSTLVDERTWSFYFLEVRRTGLFRAERWLRGILRRIRRRVQRHLDRGLTA